jgi:hypothetical protein
MKTTPFPTFVVPDHHAIGFRKSTLMTVFLAGCLLTACTIVRGQSSDAANSHPVETHSADIKKASHSIELSKINTNFTQHGGSCVLPSYAIVGNYLQANR